MQYTITLDDDTSALYFQLSQITGLTIDEMVNRQLNGHHMDVYEALALASAHPELREEVANLFLSYGPEPLLVGIKRVAPEGYLTLAELFEQHVNGTVGAVQAIC
jgi:hypothetical protein